MIFPEGNFSNPQVLVASPPPYFATPPEDEYIDARWFLTQDIDPATQDSCLDVYQYAVSLQSLANLKFNVKTLTDQDNAGGIGSSLAIPNIPSQPLQAHNVSSLVISPQTLNAISLPFYSNLPWTKYNTLRKFPPPDPNNAVYVWDILFTNTLVTVSNVARPGFLGSSIHIRTNKKAANDITRLRLQVVNQEQTAQGKDGDIVPTGFQNPEVNAFTLYFNIQPGSEDDPKNPANFWRFVINFGDVRVTFSESGAVVKAQVVGSDVAGNYIPIGVPQGKYFVNNSEFFQYAITFIPVWNGILIIPGPINVNLNKMLESSIYVPLNSKISVYTAFQYITDTLSNPYPPRFGQGDVNLDALTSFLIDPFEQYHVSFGQNIDVSFLRCGGSLKFRPVYFAPETRFHLLMYGQNNDTASVSPSGCTSQSWVFTSFPEVPNFGVFPIYHVDPMLDVTMAQGMLNVTSSNNPIWDAAVDVLVQPAGLRKPMEFWGIVVVGIPKPLGGLRTDEGSLTNADVPQDLILNVNISRNLDSGGSGDVVWDLYDPQNGVLIRPNQNAGGIQIGAFGGADTFPGVLFTGIGVGNAESDEPNSNTVKVPLHGREYKLTDSDGGLRLLMSPFFDGFDHRDVLQWLCDYANIPFQSFAGPYRLPTGPIIDPVFNFRSNTAVWDAIQDVAAKSSTLVFFNRFGVLTHYETGQISGVNWNYNIFEVLSYNDEVDFSTLRNAILVAGLVTSGPVNFKKFLQEGKFSDKDVQLQMVGTRLPTYPNFSWDRMAFYTIPGTLTQADFQLAAAKIVFGLSRMRASASVRIPGNGQVELLDTFNGSWAITGISHSISIESKTWQTTLNLELRIDGINPLNGPPPLLLNKLANYNPVRTNDTSVPLTPTTSGQFTPPWSG